MDTYATAKGQILIPAELRRKYGLKAGTKMSVSDNGDVIILKPITDETLRRLQGSLKGKGVLQALIDERRQDAGHE
jgi:AbrB family looped-hinge helix DNA binding protein